MRDARVAGIGQECIVRSLVIKNAQNAKIIDVIIVCTRKFAIIVSGLLNYLQVFFKTETPLEVVK